MAHSAIFVALVVALCISNVHALGINCRGSSQCSLVIVDVQPMQQFVNVITNNIDPNRFYDDGQQIACGAFDTVYPVSPNGPGYVCAFCQKSNGCTGFSIKTLIQELAEHGCNVCGSIPLFFPGSNDVNDGELTVNYVTDSCYHPSGFGVGLCQ